MEHKSNTHPTSSPMWCNANVSISSITEPLYDGHSLYLWRPGTHFMIWFDTPITEDQMQGNSMCYRLQGNVWFCPEPTEELPPVIIPLSTSAGNIKPSMTLTSVKMENHPEHIAVMFGQVLNNLK